MPTNDPEYGWRHAAGVEKRRRRMLEAGDGEEADNRAGVRRTDLR